MGITVREAEDADMHRLVVIASEAFARNEPFFDMILPEHWTDQGRQIGAQRWTQTKNSDPNTTYVKAVDDETGVIAGFAKWNIYVNAIPDFSKIEGGQPEFPSQEYREDFMSITKGFMVPRLGEINRTKGNVASLDVLTIHPDFQRRGVGDKLVKWGLNKADELNLDAVVESSVFGRGLYEKNGFVFDRNVDLEIPDRFPIRGPMRFAWLTRAKRNPT